MPKKNEFPLAQSPPTFGKFLEKVKGAERPKKADLVWLQGFGYKSGDHRGYLGILRTVGIIDHAGVPTDLWKIFRSPSAAEKQAFTESLRIVYAPIFGMYANPAERSDKELSDVFHANTTVGAEKVDGMVKTFRVLAGYAGMDSPAEAQDEVADESPKEKGTGAGSGSQGAAAGGKGAKTVRDLALGSGLGLNVTIQLQIPATAEADVYENLFAAMRRHLIEMSD